MDKIMLVKKEPSEGVDPTADESNALLVMTGSQMQRYAGDKKERDLMRGTLGNHDQVNVNPHTVSTIIVEATASGAAGTEPHYNALLTACGFDETVTPSTSVAYQLPATKGDLRGADSCSIYDYDPEVSLLQKSHGCRGSVKLICAQQDWPRFEFGNFLGSYETPVEDEPPAGIDFSGWLDPVPFTDDFVPTLTVDGVAAGVESMELDFAIAAVRRNQPNHKRTLLTDYKPMAKVAILAPDIATRNWWSKMESHGGTIEDLVIALQIQSAAGKVIKVDTAEASLSNIEEGESDGMRIYTMDMVIKDRPIITFE